MRKSRNQNLGKSVVIVGITAAIAQLLSVGYLVFLARWIGPETYAIHVGIFNLCMISIFFVSWGLDTWLLKTTSENMQDSGNILKRVLLLKLGFGIIWAAALFLIAPLLLPEIFLRSLLFMAIFSTLSETLTNSIYTVLLTTDRFRQSSAILLIGRLFRLLSLLGLALMSVKDLGTIVALRTLIDFIVLLVAGGILGLKFSGWSFDFGSLKQTFLLAVPFHASDLVNIIFRQMDVTLVTFMSKSLVTISNYSLMISFFNVTNTIVLSLINVLVPSLTKEKNMPVAARQKSLVRTVFGFLIIGFVGWVGIVLFGQQAFHLLLGAQYALVADLVSKTAIIVLIGSINVGLAALIIANNKQKQRVIPQVISLALKVIASLVIFPLFQIEGLRLVYILSEAVLTIGYFYLIIGIVTETSQTKPISLEPGSKLKIALITFNQEGRGTYLRAFFLGKQLTKRGHDVTILAGDIEGRKVRQREEEGLKIVTFPRLFNRLFLSGWGADELMTRLWWARNQSFDLVHAFETRPTTLIPARLLQRKGAAFFVDWADWLGKGGSVEQRPAGFKRFLLRIFETWYENRRFINSAGITVICSTLADVAIRPGYPADKILLLPNGMLNPYLQPISIEEARTKIGLPAESVIVGYIGSGFEKDMALMYSAFNALREKADNVKLLHVGRSNYNTPADKDILLTGDTAIKDVACYLSACDIFWFPSKATRANMGRLPLKLSDYLTIGRPIVSTDVGDLATWIRTLEVGKVGGDNADNISDLVLNIIRSSELKETMSKNAITASLNPELSWEKRAEDLEIFYFSRMNQDEESDDFGNDDM